MIEKFEPGMHIMVRDYDDMESDPSFRRRGNGLQSDFGFFNDRMKCFCGEDITVTPDNVTPDGERIILYDADGVEWFIFQSMAILIGDDKTELNTEGICDFFGFAI